MADMYMVKAGFHTKHFKTFEENNFIGIESDFKDLSSVENKQDLRQLSEEVYPDLSERDRRNTTNIVSILLFDFNIDDYVISFDCHNRNYIIGTVKSDYIYDEGLDTPHIRKVEWLGKIDRDNLYMHVQKNLEDTRLIFKIYPEYANELLKELENNPV